VKTPQGFTSISSIQPLYIVVPHPSLAALSTGYEIFVVSKGNGSDLATEVCVHAMELSARMAFW
jgi:hypothetical protein